MNKIPKRIFLLLAFLLMANGFLYIAFADNDEHKERRRYEKRERRHSVVDDKGNLKIANNPTYAENCGACHFVYQPELLPSGSWVKILAGLADHFGETIELDTESKKIISDYLRSNAAEFASTKLAGKIMRSIDNHPPIRITEIPYIQKKHNDIKQSILKRDAIGSLSNCSACHTTAGKGIYDDDNVTIPR
jgi:hypothetical protein